VCVVGWRERREVCVIEIYGDRTIEELIEDEDAAAVQGVPPRLCSRCKARVPRGVMASFVAGCVVCARCAEKAKAE
jgi:hypothetical protein